MAVSFLMFADGGDILSQCASLLCYHSDYQIGEEILSQSVTQLLDWFHRNAVTQSGYLFSVDKVAQATGYSFRVWVAQWIKAPGLLFLVLYGKVPSLDGAYVVTDIKNFQTYKIAHAMKEENVISKGSSGTIYRGFTKKGKMLAVKELAFGFDLDHIQYLCKLHHPHVVKQLGYCKNTNGTGLLIVHEYMEKGSLHGHLHEGVGLKNLDWRRRLKIVSGTAKALAYLHHECSSGISHGNVTTSKILLDVDYGAHLSPNIKFFAGPSASSKDSKGYLSSGYVAPDYIYAKEFTEKTDVYSFGVFLIELLTGRRPIKPEFGEHASIVDWAHALQGDGDCNRLIDQVLSESIPVYHTEMMRVMNLSIRCTSVSPAL